jgi:hypothetical protein
VPAPAPGRDAPPLGLAVAHRVTAAMPRLYAAMPRLYAAMPRLYAAMPRLYRGQAIAVEGRHPARDGIARGAPDQLGRHRAAPPVSHGQHGPGTGDLGCWRAPRAAQP